MMKYLSSSSPGSAEVSDFSITDPEKKLKIRTLKLLDNSGKKTVEIDLASDLFLEINFEVLIQGKGYGVVLKFIVFIMDVFSILRQWI